MFTFKVIKNENIGLDVLMHSKSVARYVKRFAQSMNYTSKKINYLILLALNHDIGKCRIPSNILNKRGKLTNLEYEVVKKHAQYGADILREYNHSKDFCRAIKFHHENYDGSGYYGLVGEEIPVESRIIHVVDVYDALISDRCYRKAYTKEEALTIMKSERYMYDLNILQKFIKVIDEDVTEKLIFI